MFLSQDNHIRALVLALVSPYFSHTERCHAQRVLGTYEQLAGVKRAKGKLRKWGGAEAEVVENAPLRLWERYLGALSVLCLSIYIADWYRPYTDSTNARGKNRWGTNRLMRIGCSLRLWRSPRGAGWWGREAEVIGMYATTLCLLPAFLYCFCSFLIFF